MNTRITALVVTYNRKALLSRCLQALAGQTRPPDEILIVDNASTDGTLDWLDTSGWLDRSGVSLLALPDNTGGAGGFAAGITHAMEGETNWVWLMDDDAEPEGSALENLLAAVKDDYSLYGSMAISGTRLTWPMSQYPKVIGDGIMYIDQIRSVTDVQFIPFLGLLVSRTLVDKIGVPDAGFFLAADDVDYCFRARKSGAKIMLVPDSHIEHPASECYGMEILPNRKFTSLRLPPWKRYYDVRNRLFVARNHYGLGVYYKTIPGQFLRLALTLVHEPQRLRQLHAFFAGMVDGLLGRKGRRHERWGIRAY